MYYMRKINKIFISPYDVGFFTALRDVGKSNVFQTYTSDLSFPTWLYSSLIQTGASFLELADDPGNLFSASHTMQQRLIEAKAHVYEKICTQVSDLFSAYTPKSSGEKLGNDLRQANVIVTSLLYALHSGSNLVLTMDVPNLDTYKGELSPEFYNPIRNVLQSIRNAEIYTAAPIGIIAREEIKKYESLIDSDIYSKYATAHKLLARGPNKQKLTALRVNSEKLIASNPGLLGIYNNLTYFLSLADIFLMSTRLARLGSLAIKAADFESSSKNIMIYKYKNVSLDYFGSQVELTFRRFAGDLKKWLAEGIKLAIHQGKKNGAVIEFAKKYVERMHKDKLGW